MLSITEYPTFSRWRVHCPLHAAFAGLLSVLAAAGCDTQRSEGSAVAPVRTVSITWQTRDESDLGYHVYYGGSPEDTHVLGARIIRDALAGRDAYSALFDIAPELASTIGRRVCVAVAAWRSSGDVDRSEPACITLPG